MMELSDDACGPLLHELEGARGMDTERTKTFVRDQIDDLSTRHRLAVAESRGLQTRDVIVAGSELAALLMVSRVMT